MSAMVKDDMERLTGKGLYPPRFSWALLLPFRNLYLSPGRLAKRLCLAEDSLVLEMVCGPGYFSPYIARRIPKGKLYMTDIQPEMIERATIRMRRKGVRNADLRVNDGSGLPYPDGFFDTVFMVTVLGEISDQGLFVREFHRVMRNGGTLSVSEQRGDPDSMSLERVRSVLEPVGFVLKGVYGKGRTFTANFIKPGKGDRCVQCKY
jgi:ubiquinone/menaquinone biosynthesis C-methylase UbiE